MVYVVFFKGPDMFAEFGRVSMFVCRNDAVWFLYPVLKSFSVGLLRRDVVPVVLSKFSKIENVFFIR